MGRNSTHMAAMKQTPHTAWRRALRAVGGAFARLLERAVPATPPPQSDGPPQIRFPFF